MTHARILLAFTTTIAVGCGSSKVESPAEAGAVELALQVQPGITLSSVTYTITGPGSFVRSGAIDVSQSATISSLISPIPAGSGFSITLDTASVDGALACTGSGSFNVVAHQTSSVAIHLTCHESARTGGILVTGTVNACPSIDGMGASPAEVAVGDSVTLTASAHDVDHAPSPLVYHWLARVGALSDASAQNPRFTCTAAGTATITLTVSDGDDTPRCAETGTLAVVCSPATAAACSLGNGAGAIKHVIYIQFDNTHLTRDRALVPRISSRCHICFRSSEAMARCSQTTTRF